jgi:hypothetical protein
MCWTSSDGGALCSYGFVLDRVVHAATRTPQVKNPVEATRFTPSYGDRFWLKALSILIVRCMRNIFIFLSDSCREASKKFVHGESSINSLSQWKLFDFLHFIWSLSEPSSSIVSSWVQTTEPSSS